MLNNCSGRSMIEMLGVLAIVGALSVGGIIGFTKAIAHNRVNTTISQIGVISSKLSSIGSGTDSYDGMDNAAVIKLKAAPNDMVTSASGLANPFGGNVSIYPSKLAADGDNQAYIIQYDGMDKTACIALATHNWGNAKNSSFVGFSVGSSTSLASGVAELYKKCTGKASSNYAAACSNGSAVPVPMTPVIAANACNCQQNGCFFAIKYY